MNKFALLLVASLVAAPAPCWLPAVPTCIWSQHRAIGCEVSVAAARCPQLRQLLPQLPRAKYMRYQRLTDLGLDSSMIQDNLMFASRKIGDTMTATMTPADAKTWFGVAPPDLSVVSHVRGSEWLYNYFLGFYRDDKSASGWNNLVFPNVAMPHVAWQLSGAGKLVETEFEDHEKALAGVIAVKGLAKLEPGKDGKWIMLTVAPDPDSPGTMTPVQYQMWVADLVNYLDYMAEPNKNKRISLGIMVLIYLGVLFAFAYSLKRTYWKDVH